MRLKKGLKPLPKTSKTADMEKKGRYSDGPNICQSNTLSSKSTPIEVKRFCWYSKIIIYINIYTRSFFKIRVQQGA